MVTQSISAIEMPDTGTFVDMYIAQNQPALIKGLDYDQAEWTPAALSARIGDLTSLVYGSLFDLEDVQTLEEYLETWFGSDREIEEDTPYVRWYNKLRDVEFAWGDEAFARVAPIWRRPNCLPTSDLFVPPSAAGIGTDPATNSFPYRGLFFAARGARTRLHRDPFASDAVICQFYGTKEVALYRPDRHAELTDKADGTSFGGFIDVRGDDLETISVPPDFHGYLKAGEMIYVPHGWLHDVIAIEDSVSITWNFVHARGSDAFANYLANDSDGDPELEILQYFHRPVGNPHLSAAEIAQYHFSSQG